MHMELYENGGLDTHVEGVSLLTVSYGTKELFSCFSNNKHAISNSIVFPCDAPGACDMSFFTLLSGKMGV